MWFCQHSQQMLGEDPAVNDARARGLRRALATAGQQEAQKRHTKLKRKLNTRQRKRDKQRTQRDAWDQVSHELEQCTLTFAVPQQQASTGLVLERSVTGNGPTNISTPNIARIGGAAVHINGDALQQRGSLYGGDAIRSKRRREAGHRLIDQPLVTCVHPYGHIARWQSINGKRCTCARAHTHTHNTAHQPGGLSNFFQGV